MARNRMTDPGLLERDRLAHETAARLMRAHVDAGLTEDHPAPELDQAVFAAAAARSKRIGTAVSTLRTYRALYAEAYDAQLADV